MEFYDIASETCELDESLVKRLGFKQIFLINKDVRAAGAGTSDTKESKIAFGKDKNQLMNQVKRGANAVAITDSYIDKKLIDTIKEEKCILLMPMNIITASSGIERSHNIFKMAKLFTYARKKGIEVGFASMAKTPLYLNSYIQLIELAKLIGADDKYARHSLNEINWSMVNL